MSSQLTLPAPGRASLTPRQPSGWPILPLRLFLGVSFLLAGLDKLADPGFLDPAARSYLGRQIRDFAPGTPLERILLNFAAPNATLFGALTMGGELCIGLAVLLGLLTRFSALMGLCLSLTFFLSVTWNVRPFYFGADLPYAAGWITLLLIGPGPLALDKLLRRWLAAPTAGPSTPGDAAGQAAPGRLMSRRAFLGLGTAGAASLVLAAAGRGWDWLHPRQAGTVSQLPAAGGSTPTAALPASATPIPASPTALTATGAASATPTTAASMPGATETTAGASPAAATAMPSPARRMLAAAGALPVDQALEFKLPGGDPAVLVHTRSGYSAYVATCTHSGCEVAYRAGVLACPCHGAEYDPAAGGKVLEGPAPRPLAVVAIEVGADGAVYLADNA